MYGRLDRLERCSGGVARRPASAGPEGWYDFRPREVRAKRAPSCTTGRSTAQRWISWPRDAAVGAVPRRRGRRRTPRPRCRPSSRSVRRKVERMRADYPHAGHVHVRRPERDQPGHHRRADPADARRPPGRTHRLPAALPPALLRSRPAAAPACPSRSARSSSASTEDEVTVQLVNLDPVDGAGRRSCRAAPTPSTRSPASGPRAPAARPTRVDHSHFAVRLAPGAGARLRVGMKRYANQPTLDTSLDIA